MESTEINVKLWLLPVEVDYIAKGTNRKSPKLSRDGFIEALVREAIVNREAENR